MYFFFFFFLSWPVEKWMKWGENRETFHYIRKEKFPKTRGQMMNCRGFRPGLLNINAPVDLAKKRPSSYEFGLLFEFVSRSNASWQLNWATPAQMTKQKLATPHLFLASKMQPRLLFNFGGGGVVQCWIDLKCQLAVTYSGSVQGGHCIYLPGRRTAKLNKYPEHNVSAVAVPWHTKLLAVHEPVTCHHQQHRKEKA